MLRLLGHAVWIAILTILTQLGGLAWIVATMFRRRWLAFLMAYAALSVTTLWVAPIFGRVPLPCVGEPLRMQSLMYCALNRHYVVPELAEVLEETAAKAAYEWPGTIT